MRTAERLTGLKKWVEKNLCEDREMKAPGPKMDIGKIVRQKPACFLAWAPGRLDQTGQVTEDLTSTCPGIVIMPDQAYAKNMEEKRFDRYNNIHRPPQMGQQLSVCMLFSVYEPGVRLPGFVDSAGDKGKGLDMSLIKEGTEQGLFTLTDWMDDCTQGLLRDRLIPQTDLSLDETTVTYGLYKDQNYVVDRRPIYYGYVNATFNCYADEGVNQEMKDLLL